MAKQRIKAEVKAEHDYLVKVLAEHMPALGLVMGKIFHSDVDDPTLWKHPDCEYLRVDISDTTDNDPWHRIVYAHYISVGGPHWLDRRKPYRVRKDGTVDVDKIIEDVKARIQQFNKNVELAERMEHLRQANRNDAQVLKERFGNISGITIAPSEKVLGAVELSIDVLVDISSEKADSLLAHLANILPKAKGTDE